jgi:predicted alpha-1,2-mannosidase
MDLPVAMANIAGIMMVRKRLNIFSAARQVGVATICLSGLLALRAAPPPVEEALPMVGTGGHGHTYPGATVPFGFVQLSPDTRTEGWDACSGYHYSDTNILGFSHTHLSGTGGKDLGDVCILPVTGPLGDSTGYTALSADRFKSGFSHDKELAQPGYYRVWLDRYNVLAELTASAHCGLHRYTFPSSGPSQVLIDLVHGLGGKPTAGSLEVESSTRIAGQRSNNGWAKGRTIYFVIESSQPFKAVGLEAEGKPLPAGQKQAKGKELRARLDFKTSPKRPVLLRVGLSPTSIADARKNLQAEMATWDFEAVREAARKVWGESLARIEIESDNATFRQTFYSAMYHTMSAPVLYNNADGSYYGTDRKVHPSAGFQYYSTMSQWDVFRGEMPLLTLTQPERINDLVQSMLVFYQQSSSHALPIWPLASYETSCMIGYHSVPIIYDAYQKGFRGFDPQLAFQAMRDTAMGEVKRQKEYRDLGYIPWVKGKGSATSQTLEMTYDDWCIAQMAKALGKTDDAELFTKRAQFYKNVWDPKTRFFRSKRADGTYQDPFDPKEVSRRGGAAEGYYTEADAWQYTFAVLHDVPGMIELYGGNSAFIERLDEFFNGDSDMTRWQIDVTGLIGQYAHGNEPDQQAPYLYALAGAQYKTAARVRQVQLTQYDNTQDGLCGNDDCGQISAWYVWSALGFYPVNPSSGVYVIGSPLVRKAVLHLDPKYYKGGTFTVMVHDKSAYARADRMNNYIQSATLNGQPLNRPWITHDEIVNGGTLDLEMGLLPNKAWAAGN